MKYFYAILLCLLGACAITSMDDITASDTIINNHQSTLITVYADNSFPEEKQIMLSAAFAKWSIKTDNRVRFDIMFIAPEELREDYNIKNTYYVHNRNPVDPKYVGFCRYQNGAMIEIEPNVSMDMFTPIALHEIGHALHLEHYSGKYTSVMEDSLKNGKDISCYDLITFCKFWDCNMPCELELVEK